MGKDHDECVLHRCYVQRQLVTTGHSSLVVFIYLLLSLTVTGLVTYLPARVSLVQDRMSYYFFGGSQTEAQRKLMTGWVGRNLTGEL